MATEEEFIGRFEMLRGEQKAIPPETRAELLPQHIKDAIAALDDAQIELLNQLAKDTKSHIFLHDHQNNVIAMGL